MSYKFEFSQDKNLWLQENRGVSFEEVLNIINEGGIIEVAATPNQEKHPGQIMYVLEIRGYCHLVPCDIDKNDLGKRTLKTIYKSKKAHTTYIKNTKR